MKKNTKGFTLVELLAVIVILAVIALIATPLVLQMIDSARKGAAESSALSYINAVENAILTNLMSSASVSDYDGEYSIDGLTLTQTKNAQGQVVSSTPISFTIELKGDQPVDSNDSVTIKNNVVSFGQLTFGKYKITYSFAGGTATYCSATGDTYPSCNATAAS